MSLANRLYAVNAQLLADVQSVAIALKIDAETRHVGILFRRTMGEIGQLRFLDLAFHHWVRCIQPKSDYKWLKLDVEPERQKLVAQLCELIEQEYVNSRSDDRRQIGYAFHYRGEQFDPASGVFMTQEGYGLTCATFVLAVFASHGIDLLALSGWQPREEDKDWQQCIVEMMRRHRNIEEVHIAFIEKEIGCCRFRPEEVAAAGTVNGTNLPLAFRDAETRGKAIVEELFGRATD